MRMSVTWLRRGRFQVIRFTVCGWRLKIFLQRPAARSGSYLGGGLHSNSAGYLVRDDPPLATISAHTVVVRPPALTSH